MTYSGAKKIWYKNGLKHRANGPAVVNNAGKNMWYYNDKFLGDNGPYDVVECPCGEAWARHKSRYIACVCGTLIIPKNADDNDFIKREFGDRQRWV